MARRNQNEEAFLSQRTRYGIMSKLMEGPKTFATLIRQLNLTDGNLAVHSKALEAREYLDIKKEFVDSRPQTTYSLTAKGRAAMETYLGTGGAIH